MFIFVVLMCLFLSSVIFTQEAVEGAESPTQEVVEQEAAPKETTEQPAAAEQEVAQPEATEKKNEDAIAPAVEKTPVVETAPATEETPVTEAALQEEPATEVAKEESPKEEVKPATEAPSEAVAVEAATPAQATSVEPMPTPVADEEIIIPDTEATEEQPKGIDTVSLEDSQGNWLFKRIWWERSEERYGKIRGLVDKIWESRTTFFVKRNELDRKILDPFYLSVGVGQGELQVILTELNDFFEKEREQQGDLNDQERTLFETLTVEQESLKQLKLDVESIVSLDHALDDALGMLMDQINRVRQFEKQAWENFKEIAHILNDVKARELYYMIDGAGRNIKNISNYIEQDFLNHFNKLIEQAKKHVTRVQQQIERLKEKGVDFKRQVDRAAIQEKQEKERQALEAAAQEEEEVEVAPKKGWFDSVMSVPKTIWDWVVYIVQLPYNMIFGGRQ